ncbi:hypothetical protein [Verrucosispora sioxanthis]|uniref:hypothetical protein n=1 Tax=Verrucosispora sioxanthis TaxID=2499994 RepID=UPI001C0F8DC9|nr:hypothetical protein [Verrucosispora sioxanthis]
MGDPLDQLAGVPAARDRLDETELDLIDRARLAGATWAQVAEALGLASRQAAEQRAGEVAVLRGLLIDLRRWIDADRRWDARFDRAALTRRTTMLALEAEPGGLYDLANRIRADLPTNDPELPAPVRAVARHLAEALSTRR